MTVKKSERTGSKFYWEGWDAEKGGKPQHKNPYEEVPGDALELEKANDPHFMWDFGYEMSETVRLTYS
jgi:hypothetical protein